MKLRPIIFWSHLSCGVAAGLVIVMMSVTGVILTYEHQMALAADMSMLRAEDTDRQRMPLEAVIESANAEFGRQPAGIIVRPDAGAPYEVTFGRRGPRGYFDAFTGEHLGEGNTELRDFFGLMTRWHRWFALEGESRDTGRMITGVSNLMFLFLVLSGIYLWLPKTWKWLILRTHVWFNPRVDNAKARDYNWHHVFGIWSAIPLVVVVATAVVFSYSWANDLVFWLAGDDTTASAQAGGGAAGGMGAAMGAMGMGGGNQGGQRRAPELRPGPGEQAMELDELLATVQQQAGGWEKITVVPPSGPGTPVSMTIHGAEGHQPQLDETWSINPYNGEVLATSGWSDRPRGTRARTAVRYLHTGEYLGITGQTIAGLVSAFSVLMAWTGVALAWRRLVSPVLRRRRMAAMQPDTT